MGFPDLLSVHAISSIHVGLFCALGKGRKYTSGSLAQPQFIKLGQLVRTDLVPLKRFSFSSTPPSFDSTVITLSRDIVHKFEKKLTFAGKKQFLLFIIRQAKLLPLSVTFVFVF